MDTFKLNNGVDMPVMGLGTYALPIESLERIMGVAYNAGYCMFDTAWYYHNEEEIGNALKRLKIPREDVFISSKLDWDDVFYVENNKPIHKKSIKEALEGSLQRLQLDYLDLYLIHWPWFNFEYLWDSLCELYCSGVVRAIGVSSFQSHHLEKIIAGSNIIPAVNQIELHPYGQQKQLVNCCKSNGILCEAFSQFGVPHNGEDIPLVTRDSILVELGGRYNKSVQQIILRWLYQNQVVSIPRSKNTKNIINNIDIFDFSLTLDEMNLISALNKDIYTWPRKLVK